MQCCQPRVSPGMRMPHFVKRIGFLPGEGGDGAFKSGCGRIFERINDEKKDKWKISKKKLHKRKCDAGILLSSTICIYQYHSLFSSDRNILRRWS